jgi:arginase
MRAPPSLVALRCRTSDRSAGGARGVDALADALSARLGVDARRVGEPGEPRDDEWKAALQSARGCLLEAGGQVQDALRGGRVPVLLAAECSVALATLPALAQERPDARVLWLDAHGDFNTPETTPSGYLGGMALAAACGAWDAGFAPSLDAGRVVLAGARELDEEERETLARTSVRLLAPSSALAERARLALDGAPVYVHLDIDVLDPQVMPAVAFPAAGGLSEAALADLLGTVARDCELVGLEIAAFDAPAAPAEAAGLARLIGEMVAPLLAG